MLEKTVYYVQALCLSNKKVYLSLEKLIDEYKEYILNTNALYSLYKDSNQIQISFDLELKIMKSTTGNYYNLYCTITYYLSEKELNKYHHNDVIYLFALE